MFQNAFQAVDSEEDFSEEEYTSEEDSEEENDTRQEINNRETVDNRLEVDKPDTETLCDRLSEEREQTECLHTSETSHNSNNNISQITRETETVNTVTSDSVLKDRSDVKNSPKLLDGTELVDVIKQVFKGKRVQAEHLTVGMVK